MSSAGIVFVVAIVVCNRVRLRRSYSKLQTYDSSDSSSCRPMCANLVVSERRGSNRKVCARSRGESVDGLNGSRKRVRG
jgi:hypothetical protein